MPGGAVDARRVLDDAVAATVARGTAWVRQRARAGDGAPDAGHLRLEGAVDLRRRVCVGIEAVLPPAGPRRVAERGGDARDESYARGRRVVYAGGSRYVEGERGWEHAAGEISGPRRPSDPMWLLDALAYADDCVDAGPPEIGGRLDLSEALDVDRSAIVPERRRVPIVRSRERRAREAWLRRVPCVVTLGGDGTIASMAFAAVPPGPGGGLLWATTEFVEYGVPVAIPDLTRVPARERGADGPAQPCPTRSSPG
jgi:hypothetical protein